MKTGKLGNYNVKFVHLRVDEGGALREHTKSGPYKSNWVPQKEGGRTLCLIVGEDKNVLAAAYSICYPGDAYTRRGGIKPARDKALFLLRMLDRGSAEIGEPTVSGKPVSEVARIGYKEAMTEWCLARREVKAAKVYMRGMEQWSQVCKERCNAFPNPDQSNL